MDIGQGSLSSRRASSVFARNNNTVPCPNDVDDDDDAEMDAISSTKGGTEVDHVAVDREWTPRVNTDTDIHASSDDDTPAPKSDSTPPDNTFAREYETAVNSNPTWMAPWVLIRWKIYPLARNFVAIKGMLTDELEEEFRRVSWSTLLTSKDC